ncbi:T6SS phospholipase effector Tle1-like catalytic domain-containing protein [Rhizobium leguminosarum]|uniref:T6SS phospholipase effector Tle1-like catalytic domain-containing protein n=1 Tax=Rhizobium leguminosarum TaxID=384 RepID=UPI0003646EB4|nr:DUF2235 domain-containing protein [Rhizobium leguminosarum]
MGKNIVILFDGTSNEIAADRTNILRLFGVLKRSSTQIVYYDPGVGTFGAANAWSRAYRKSIEVWGLATGWGLDQNVKEAYRFIVDNYEHAPRGSGEDSDRIHIFGFSRGAYGARVLAGFIHALGIVSRHHVNLIDYAYRTYKGISDNEAKAGGFAGATDDDAPSAFSSMRLYERTLKTYRPKIKLLGLFDTVASVIEMGKWLPQLRTLPFTRKNPSVEWVRHAMAIDERRTMFNPMPSTPGQEYWGGPFRPKEPVPQNVKEVWFAGVHGDVGGGYPEKESGIIKIPLEWMISETKQTGLDYIDQTVKAVVLGNNSRPIQNYVAPNAQANPHHSMTAGWRLLEYIPRRVPETSWRKRGNREGIYLPLQDRRFIPDGAVIHQSVIDRGNLSPNLPRQGSFTIEPWSDRPPAKDGPDHPPPAQF